jgi:transposase
VPRLSKEEIMTLHVLKEKDVSNVDIAKTLGITEAAVRYRLRRGKDAPDGRANKEMKADEVAGPIREWIEEHDKSRQRPGNRLDLLEWLRTEHGWKGSYSALHRFLAKHFPPPALRPNRRVEMPPGAQGQVDWLERRDIDLGNGPETLYGFVLSLSHCRKPAVIWCRRMDQLHWHQAHNEAFRRLGGVPAVLRIDNLKTGVVGRSGGRAVINEAYKSYARSLGFLVEACLPRHPEGKGKVERRIGRLQKLFDTIPDRITSLEELQVWTDEQVEQLCSRWVCPATGKSIQETWRDELGLLRPVADLPEPFDKALTRRVSRDCLVAFESHQYSVPFVLAEREVEVRGCADTVRVYYEGKCHAVHPRGTPALLLVDDAHYEGESTEDRHAPTPLSHIAKRIKELAEQEVEYRSSDYYANLVLGGAA